MAGLQPAAVLSGGELSGTEFGQRLSVSEQEQFHMSADFYDKTVNSQYMEVYLYYSKIEREKEAADTRPIPDSTWTIVFKYLTGQRHKVTWGTEESQKTVHLDESKAEEIQKEARVGSLDMTGNPALITSEERDLAYRRLRMASWQAVFYLITTDILGYTSASATFGDLGYGPGVITYVFFYLLAVFGGQVIWRLYCDYDSSRYPVVCYADLGERTFGRWVRHLFNVLQSGQLLFNVAILINGNAITLAVLTHYGVCYMVLALIWFVVGGVGGQIKTLKNFSWFANCNVWLNMIVMIMTIYGVSQWPPNPTLTGQTGPILKTGWVPYYSQGSWYKQVQGVQYAIFAYGGAMIFPEFMAEMRRPRDFWKSALCAQFFCFFIYMMFGLICYSYGGQYATILEALDFIGPPGSDGPAILIATNTLGLFTTIIAAVLYGNIGVKVFYENVLRAYFNAPSITSTKGSLLFRATTLTYWGIAWFIAVAIPLISALITLVGATFILQFTYTFPPVLALGYWMQKDAIAGDNKWEPGMTPGSNRIDTWRDKSRWTRGFKRYWYVKTLFALMFVAAIANMALGMYAGIETAIESFADGYGQAFSCRTAGQPPQDPTPP